MNRSVSMDRIKYIGFDMDYTLVGMLCVCVCVCVCGQPVLLWEYSS